MRILTGKDIDRLVVILEQMTRDIGKLKDGTCHPNTCGCPDCDHEATIYNLIKRIGD